MPHSFEKPIITVNFDELSLLGIGIGIAIGENSMGSSSIAMPIPIAIPNIMDEIRMR